MPTYKVKIEAIIDTTTKERLEQELKEIFEVELNVVEDDLKIEVEEFKLG